MMVHFINLPHRTDRAAYIKMLAARENLPYTIHEGVYFKDIRPVPDVNQKLQGHVGCLYAHKKVLRQIQGSANLHIIMEDDVDILLNFSEIVYNLLSELPEDWKLCYLGGNIHQIEGSTEPHSLYLRKAKSVLATHAYIIRDSAIDSLLSVLDSRDYKVDILFCEFQKLGGCYISAQCLAWQRETMSDITGHKNTINTRY